MRVTICLTVSGAQHTIMNPKMIWNQSSILENFTGSNVLILILFINNKEIVCKNKLNKNNQINDTQTLDPDL